VRYNLSLGHFVHAEIGEVAALWARCCRTHRRVQLRSRHEHRGISGVYRVATTLLFRTKPGGVWTPIFMVAHPPVTPPLGRQGMTRVIWGVRRRQQIARQGIYPPPFGVLKALQRLISTLQGTTLLASLRTIGQRAQQSRIVWTCKHSPSLFCAFPGPASALRPMSASGRGCQLQPRRCHNLPSVGE
jgi:hypothetical protein